MNPHPTPPPQDGGKQEHSKLPWKIVRRHPDAETNANYVEIMPETGGCWGEWSSQEICSFHGASEGSIQLANAELVVSSVNSIAGMRERVAELEGALRKVVACIDSGHETHTRKNINYSASFTDAKLVAQRALTPPQENKA